MGVAYQGMRQVENLEMYDTNAMLVGQTMRFTSISSLEIGGMDKLVILPFGLLQYKKTLKHLL